MLLAKFLYKTKDNKHSIPLLCREKKNVLTKPKKVPWRRLCRKEEEAPPWVRLVWQREQGYMMSPCWVALGTWPKRIIWKWAPRLPWVILCVSCTPDYILKELCLLTSPALRSQFSGKGKFRSPVLDLLRQKWLTGSTVCILDKISRGPWYVFRKSLLEIAGKAQTEVGYSTVSLCSQQVST